MSEIEEVQEQMKADIEAMKGQMTAMMEAMMGMRRMMEVNTATVVAASTATKVDLTTHLASIKKHGANGENKKEGGTHVVTTVPTWPNFPPAQQYQYSANISPSHYPPPYQPRTPNHPQRPPLNQPQNPPAAHLIPNTTLNMNQNPNYGRNFPEKKHVEFTPIPVTYVNLLPYLLNNTMVAIMSAKVPEPPFS
ncbi:hypothetical protein HKD37_01G001195 [Glycine soja]